MSGSGQNMSAQTSHRVSKPAEINTVWLSNTISL